MTGNVVIVGRPNVGKSTLFNRLVGRREALVHDTPGVTRDRRHGNARLGRLAFPVVDTAGLEDVFDDSLPARTRQQTERALDGARLALFVVDARTGLMPVDEAFADWLRRQGVPVVVVANKCEGRAAEAGMLEAHALGLGEPIALSAEHGLGLDTLEDRLVELLEPDGEPDAVAPAELPGRDDAEAADDDGRPIRLAVVGRPNVGKSTLVNALLTEDRVVTGPEPGVTRDAVEVPWSFEGRSFVLIDTAGLRRRARVQETLERLSTESTRKAIRLAQAVILVVDATAPLEKQDLTIAAHVVEEGRLPIIALSKWDLIDDHAGVLRSVRERLEISLPQIKTPFLVTVSAVQGLRLAALMRTVLQGYAVWNRRVGTGPLNRWLQDAVAQHPPPVVKGRRLKLRYATQIKSRPPTFALWATRAEEIPESYLRYLSNGLRQTFDLPGVPIRLTLRKGKNPYA